MNIKKHFGFLFAAVLCLALGLAGVNTACAQGQTAAYEKDLSALPPYSGEAFAKLNGNKPYFETVRTDVFEDYSQLDSLGRCGAAYANICKELMPTEERGAIGQIRPSGWHTVNYHDLIDGNFLFNRCHLIGYQLAGENANEQNLITGTRYLNVEGMLPFENQVADYVHATGHHVNYRVTPVFEGNNLVCGGVIMEAASVEDADLSFCVYVYNVQPGIEIDYATGDSHALDNAAEIVKELSEKKAAAEDALTGANGGYAQSAVSSDSVKYVINTNTGKFHYPSCDSVKKISDKNRQDSDKTRDELVAEGYDPCGKCRP